MTPTQTDRPGIFIYGYYGMHNAGDDLLAEACVTNLRKLGKYKFYLRNYDDVPLSQNQDVVLTHLEKMKSGHKSLFSKIIALGRYFSAHRRIFKHCSSFILGGGTLISDNSSTMTLLILAFLVSMARCQKMSCHALGLGLGPIRSGFKRRLASYILRRLSSLNLRDQASLELAKSYAPLSGARLTADMAYSLPEYFAPPAIQRQENKIIGLTLAGPYLQKKSSLPIKTHLMKALLPALTKLIDQGYSVRCLSLQELDAHNGSRASDSEIFSELLDSLSKEKVEIRTLNASAIEVGKCYSQLDLLIGMRLHSAILSSMHFVPFVGFSHDHKMQEICNE